MTRAEAVAVWRQFYYRARYPNRKLPRDLPAIREAWGIYTDDLCKAGKITLRQYETWAAPKECKAG